MDDHEVVRRGVRDMLTVASDIEIVGEAGTAAEALARLPALRPDVAVLDVRLPDGNGIEVCRGVRSAAPGVRCLILTSFSDEEALSDAVLAGASGYVLKAVGGQELLAAVRDAAAGRSLLGPGTERRVVERLRARGGGGRDGGRGDGSGDGSRGAVGGAGHRQRLPDDRAAVLTPQEQRVLELIGEGLTNRAIGERLHLAEKTVKNYVSGLLAKLGMERRSQAAAHVARAQAARDARDPRDPRGSGRGPGSG